MKPLGKKSYGSIPHLIGSKLGPGDHTIHQGQHDICTLKTRDKHDFIIVQEKYDGSNVAVANIGGEIVALTRRGYLAETSPFEQHHKFAQWVSNQKHRFLSVVYPGDRLCGEWLLQAHGVLYDISNEPFVAFDYFQNSERITVSELHNHLRHVEFNTPQLIAIGFESRPIEQMLKRLKTKPRHAVNAIQSLPEGLIYRVERKGRVEFLAKYVRHDFEPGIYLPEMSGRDAIWNFFKNI
jgi:hypothetical protein